LPALREAIAATLRRENALDYEADEIIVTAGVQESIMLCMLALSLGAGASLPVSDFRAIPVPGDDLQASLHLAFTVWAPSHSDANWLAGQSGITPDDFQVAVFLTRQSGWTLPAIWGLRNGGMEWSTLAARCGVPWETIVVRPARDYGEPYGKAWGYWAKDGDRRGFSLTDGEFVQMVRVQTLSIGAGLTPDQIMEGLRDGRSYQQWAGGVYREKHGRGTSGHEHHGEHVSGYEDGHGHGHHEEHGEDHGHREDDDDGHGRGRGHGRD
jgi:hypothetical protein